MVRDKETDGTRDDAAMQRVGQELGGYAAQVRLAVTRVQKAIRALRELPLGGTAVGTGINSHPKYAAAAIVKNNAYW